MEAKESHFLKGTSSAPNKLKDQKTPRGIESKETCFTSSMGVTQACLRGKEPVTRESFRIKQEGKATNDAAKP